MALAVMAVLSYPAGTPQVLKWAADHDGVDVPYVRDCHGIFRHPDECPSHSASAEAGH